MLLRELAIVDSLGEKDRNLEYWLGRFISKAQIPSAQAPISRDCK